MSVPIMGYSVRGLIILMVTLGIVISIIIIDTMLTEVKLLFIYKESKP